VCEGEREGEKREGMAEDPGKINFIAGAIAHLP
jgi:hypothetical protein